MLTVYAILEYSLDIADKLGLESIVVILDQPTQVNAQQIQWQNEVFFKWLVIRLGDFHTV